MIVYTVEGSEDGLILATQRQGDAVAEAQHYVERDGSEERRAIKAKIRENLKTMNRFCIELSNGGIGATLTVWDSKG